MSIKRAQNKSHILPRIPVELRFTATIGRWDLASTQKTGHGWKFHYDQEHENLSVEYDPWEVRNDFFGLRTDDELITFLDRTGRWDGHVLPLQLSDFWEWQDVLRRVLRSVGRWRMLKVNGRKLERIGGHALRLSLSKDGRRSVISAMNTLEALLNATTVDLLEGSEWKVCSACPRLFKVGSEHGQKYCSRRCGHRVNVAKIRQDLKRKHPAHPVSNSTPRKTLHRAAA